MDVDRFLKASVDLYYSAPGFFNYSIPILIGGYLGFLWAGYGFGKWVQQSEIAGLKATNDAGKAQNDALKAQNDVGKERAIVMEERLKLAKEQQDISTKEAAALKNELGKLKGQIESRAPQLELQNSTSVIEGNLNRLIGASTAASHYLGHVSTGFDENGRLTWRPIRPDEEEKLLGLKPKTGAPSPKR
ncbi:MULTISPECIES: hypothetical protein [unclassified Bradyrhizobium]|uniref:hypothetical protein n=1 Tax=unclassified Bradyrhizobium TaxID=2631580 RepID=UPI001BA67BBC|nr:MULTISPECIES: hypothetical protein [unclassified Bradyrhizobium]MBR1204477.1 hypothetical protein [Bradyrhizobium sp. AUGA SZCCT0124]MBR1309637.1 hypothetical protein [Bradyrhizobium sp. AUGA SZCCT0051]MBR1339778.1 hypothetical protein [Bradyrhizobium sp. AUGA SZCCT0105]MBR1354385.1 hypothetical protein [Bradyrhizobium sp. AUGA SZCCT0045]